MNKLKSWQSAAYSINRYRTVEHDSAFGIRQIVDVALRALSPSIRFSPGPVPPNVT